ncbi:Carbonic anhydrase 2 [Corynebacterium cystitidis DSM 20524]|uniref:Carbonic anhydrase n=2 Tax=Corynebacterium cystitidis TaxID=35757 RepID=A0A1H9W840_9CORY|nr:Carbonic anhydrase 2 [Corynebacterium cystitidis DSM 20524]SES30015.1 carbonic anhydrase [Corynebacterium cystitidis DSM 20524]SNV63860.1 beta-type carbonic anhydrase-like protein [Corynebacterium cystitidis]
MLKEGNRRFAGQSAQHPHSTSERLQELQSGQDPIAAVLACSDSRAPVELIFDTGFGDLFVVRTAGECTDAAVLGSLEFAVKNLNIGLVIVLGHENCGAVGAAIYATKTGEVPVDSQRVFIEKIVPSVLESKGDGEIESDNVEAAHAAITAEQLIMRIPSIDEALRAGELGVVAARYRLSDGQIEEVAKHGVR